MLPKNAIYAMFYSADNGKTWTQYAILGYDYAIQALNLTGDLLIKAERIG